MANSLNMVGQVLVMDQFKDTGINNPEVLTHKIKVNMVNHRGVMDSNNQVHNTHNNSNMGVINNKVMEIHTDNKDTVEDMVNLMDMDNNMDNKWEVMEVLLRDNNKCHHNILIQDLFMVLRLLQCLMVLPSNRIRHLMLNVGNFL